MTKPTALILHAPGTNRDKDIAFALELAGAKTEIIPLTVLKQEKIAWSNYHMLILPGGFSYADILGAGKLFALDLNTYFLSEIQQFVESGKPVLGVCNGFQALVKAGILPGNIPATLTFNASGQFECRWVRLEPVSKKCVWTQNLTSAIECPVAHGEGRFVLQDQAGLEALKQQDQIALVYAGENYPNNPNGSIANIAGVCNPRGNVLGLMPHPENHVLYNQYPHWTRGEKGLLGLKLFESVIM